MPSKLSKVQKRVTKKKGEKAKSLHENSRDAQRLRRAGARDERVSRVSAVREKSNKRWIDRVAFLQDGLPDILHPLEKGQMHALIQGYLGRNDEELQQLQRERRSGRAKSTRQSLLEQQRATERQEYESGFWLPDLSDEETLLKLDKWPGDWSGLGILKFMRLDSNDGLHESQFPPRGAS